MRKLYSMRAYLTLCILAISTLIGGVSAQAQTKAISEFTDKNLTVAAGSPQWTTDVTATQFEGTNNKRGVQWGTKKGTIKVTSTDNFTNVKSVEVVASTNGSGNTISVSVGNIQFETAKTISSGTTNANKTYTFTGNATGSVIVTLNDNASSVWVKSISVTYENIPTPKIIFEQDSYKMDLGGSLTIKATATFDETTLAENLITYYSSNTDIAEIDSQSGTVTAKTEGTVTIIAKIEADADNTYGAATTTCELTVKDPRTAPEFSFSEESYTINVNEAKQILPTTNSNGEISYASSNDAVATVDAEGNVKGIAEGDATITATIAATNGYKPATATYQIKVVDPNKPAEVVTPMSFKKVTSTDELIDGGQYIIVCEDQNVAMTTISSNKGETTNITIKGDNSIEIETISATVNIYTMSVATDGYFQLINGDKMLSTGGVKSTNLSLTAQSSTDDNAKWKLSDNGLISKSNAESTETKRAILLNSNSLLGHYAVSNLNNGYHTTQLYRLETSATINEKIGYTTFYTDKVYQLANGMTAYTINESDEAGKVNAIEAYAAGEDVPANTALLLGGEAGTYRLPVLNKEVAAYEGENLLEGKRMADGMTRSDRENVLYYKLTTLNGEDPGFYWGAEEGAAFIMKNPTTAYLAVDKAVAGANGLRLVIGESGTTGIGTVTETTQDGAIYTISGVRVNAGSTAGLPKGIYIVNGKKLLVK